MEEEGGGGRGEEEGGGGRGERETWRLNPRQLFFAPIARPFVPFASEHVRHSQMAPIHFVYAASLILQPLLWFPRCRPTCLSFAPPCLFAVSFACDVVLSRPRKGVFFFFSLGRTEKLKKGKKNKTEIKSREFKRFFLFFSFFFLV